MIVSSLLVEAPTCDVCVVGTGPAGIAVALECERHGLKVLALEAGGEEEPRAGSFNANDVETSTPNHSPLDMTTRTAFGGTSLGWAGGCIAFDDVDFDKRQHVPDSGWPLPHKEVAQYYDAAARVLNCTPGTGWPVAPHKPHDRSVDEIVFALSAQPNLAITNRDHFARSQSIHLALNSKVIAINLTDDGTEVASLTVVSGGQTVVLKPPRVVLAAGGIKTTHLLLTTQTRWPSHFGGAEGALGRYYMGHLCGSIASISFRDPAPPGLLPPQEGGVPERRLTISHGKQLSERLMNVAFWPNAALFFDPSHGDGVLSAAFLAFATPKIGNLFAGSLRRAYLGPEPRRLRGHLTNVLRSPLATVAGLGRLLYDGLTDGPGIGVRARRAGIGVYTLQYHAEAEPKRDSRVFLSDKVDEFGIPRLSVDLLFSDHDATSVVRAHDVLDKSLRSSGIASLDYLDPPDQRAQNVLSQAHDGYHQLGTTRMGTDPKVSVVDTDCRVHGIGNLFIASSSVFPTSGHANPTLLIAALGVRLAEHLAQLVKGANAVVSPRNSDVTPFPRTASGETAA